MTGTVTLVGGGPGDPGLLTLAGLTALRAADVVLYDNLAPTASLAQCRPDTLLVDVGKIPGGRSTSQDRINQLLIEHARAGRAVVRFKGGDPFVFGRGGEEVLACAEAGVPVVVVPGVSSATAAPALAGIPVTHRGVVQAFTVVSGHVPPGHAGSTTDWAAMAKAGHTVVILMGMANLGPICTELIEHGLPGSTPAAVIADAGLPGMRTLRGTITDIAASVREHGVRPPAVVVVGDLAAQQLPVLPPADTGTATDELRRATAADAGELLVLQRACWMVEALDNDTFAIPPLHEGLADVLAEIDRHQTWVLRRRGRLIGSVRGTTRGSDWNIGRLMVAADLTGQGLGRRLLAHIEAQAPPSVTRFVLFTGARSERNQRLYGAAGYTLVPDGTDPTLSAIPGAVILTKPA